MLATREARINDVIEISEISPELVTAFTISSLCSLLKAAMNRGTQKKDDRPRRVFSGKLNRCFGYWGHIISAVSGYVLLTVGRLFAVFTVVSHSGRSAAQHVRRVGSYGSSRDLIVFQ